MSVRWMVGCLVGWSVGSVGVVDLSDIKKHLLNIDLFFVPRWPTPRLRTLIKVTNKTYSYTYLFFSNNIKDASMLEGVMRLQRIYLKF